MQFSPEAFTFEPPKKSPFVSGNRTQSTRPDMSRILASRTVPSKPGPSYQSLFQASAEIPRFFVSYRWWEDEATTILWAFNVQEISRVIRYGLFRDENFPRSSLLSRNADTIDAFLVALSDPREHQLLATLSHMQRVEEILRRSSIPACQPVPWSWLPPPPTLSLDARAIAAAIEAESHFHFTQIAFEEIVRCSLGYNAASVDWFLQQHTAFHIHLVDHLRMYPEDIPLYAEVEKHLRPASPFAHRAVLQCLRAVRPSGNRDMPTPAPGFEFITGPIQRLFKDQPPSLTTILKMFSVLGVRFRRQYIHTPTMDWRVKFNTDIPFLEDCLTSMSAMDLARTLTSTDEIDFASLSRQNILAEDALVVRFLADWRALSGSVWECCSALPDLIPYLQECAQILYTTRNYHSLTAFLDGLHKYSISTVRAPNMGPSPGIGGNSSTVIIDPVIPADLLFLIDPAQTHTAYRQHYRQHPGIPFLIPHIRDYKQHGEPALQPLLQYMQSNLAFRR